MVVRGEGTGRRCFVGLVVAETIGLWLWGYHMRYLYCKLQLENVVCAASAGSPRTWQAATTFSDIETEYKYIA